MPRGNATVPERLIDYLEVENKRLRGRVTALENQLAVEAARREALLQRCLEHMGFLGRTVAAVPDPKAVLVGDELTEFSAPAIDPDDLNGETDEMPS